jgi:hypothetical protein
MQRGLRRFFFREDLIKEAINLLSLPIQVAADLHTAFRVGVVRARE